MRRSPRATLARWTLALGLGLAGYSVAGCGGDRPPGWDVDVPRKRLASSDARRQGRDLYLQHCALCHGERADGHGVRANLSSRPADFSDAHWRRRVSPREVFLAIRDGVAGTAMPAWKVLEEDEIWDLTAYVLSVAEKGPTTAAEVSASGS